MSTHGAPNNPTSFEIIEDIKSLKIAFEALTQQYQHKIESFLQYPSINGATGLKALSRYADEDIRIQAERASEFERTVRKMQIYLGAIKQINLHDFENNPQIENILNDKGVISFIELKQMVAQSFTLLRDGEELSEKKASIFNKRNGLEIQEEELEHHPLTKEYDKISKSSEEKRTELDTLNDKIGSYGPAYQHLSQWLLSQMLVKHAATKLSSLEDAFTFLKALPPRVKQKGENFSNWSDDFTSNNPDSEEIPGGLKLRKIETSGPDSLEDIDFDAPTPSLLKASDDDSPLLTQDALKRRLAQHAAQMPDDLDELNLDSDDEEEKHTPGAVDPLDEKESLKSRSSPEAFDDPQDSFDMRKQKEMPTPLFTFSKEKKSEDLSQKDQGKSDTVVESQNTKKSTKPQT